jgi:hypothetical protein
MLFRRVPTRRSLGQRSRTVHHRVARDCFPGTPTIVWRQPKPADVVQLLRDGHRPLERDPLDEAAAAGLRSPGQPETRIPVLIADDVPITIGGSLAVPTTCPSQ